MKFFSLFRIAALLLLGALTSCQNNPAQTTASEPQLQLGLQAWTFRTLSFVETLDQAKSLGLTRLQAYPGQRLGASAGPTFHHEMDATSKALVKQELQARGITLVSYGVVTGKSEAEWRKIFDFAREMGMTDIASEPKAGDLELVAKLAAETGIKVGIHNHPAPSGYADPEIALAAAAKGGAMLGLCADTGHWQRDGRDPVAVLREAAGRIVSVHFKDLAERNVRSASDLPWGTGTGAAARQIAELRRQNFPGVVYVEYERVTPTLEKEVRHSVDFFRRAAAAPLADLTAGRILPAGFFAEDDPVWRHPAHTESAQWPTSTPLFAPDLSDAELKPGTWVWEEGVLVAKGAKDWKGGVANIWTKKSYGDFVLSLEFRCGAKGNSGVFLRTGDIVNWLNTSTEIQILQGDYPGNDRYLLGALTDSLEPSRKIEIAPDTWHRLTIRARGSSIRVAVDGQEVTVADLAQWTEVGKNPDGTSNKFKVALRDLPLTGRIGLQYHGQPLAFRNMVIEEYQSQPDDRRLKSRPD